MPTSFVVVDDFLANPDELRNAALRLTYPAQTGAFPGRNSSQRVTVDGLEQEVSRILGEPLQPINPLQSHAKCRITLAGEKGRAGVHIDKSHWSGILYLSRPEHCQGGTEFYRHRRTGTDRAPINPGELRALGYGSAQEMYGDIIERDTLDPGAWDFLMRVPMRFNRLVLLRPWFWHTAGAGFGDSVENGRLVYLMFFAQSTR